jgi:hypothetical protein
MCSSTVFNLGVRWGSVSQPHPDRYTRGNDPVPTIQEAGLAPGLVWIGAEKIPQQGFDHQTVHPGSSRVKRLKIFAFYICKQHYSAVSNIVFYLQAALQCSQ